MKNKTNVIKRLVMKKMALKKAAIKKMRNNFANKFPNAKIDKRTHERIYNCPKCGTEMKKRTNGKYIIDVCATGCGGVFLDRDEINNINKQGFIHYTLSYFKKQ